MGRRLKPRSDGLCPWARTRGVRIRSASTPSSKSAGVTTSTGSSCRRSVVPWWLAAVGSTPTSRSCPTVGGSCICTRATPNPTRSGFPAGSSRIIPTRRSKLSIFGRSTHSASWARWETLYSGGCSSRPASTPAGGIRSSTWFTAGRRVRGPTTGGRAGTTRCSRRAGTWWPPSTSTARPATVRSSRTPFRSTGAIIRTRT